MIGLMILWICLMIGIVAGTAVYDFALSMGLIEPAAFGLGVVGFMIGASALPAAFILGDQAYRRKRYSVTVFGTQPWYKATESEIDECLNCGVEDVDGYEIEWGRYRVAFGLAWRQIDGGVHQDCTACHEDPIEAALRRKDSSRVGGVSTSRNPAMLGDPSLAHMNASGGQEESA